MARRERDFESVRGGIRKALNAVGPEVVILALLAVGNDGGAGGFESCNGVLNGLLIKRSQCRVSTAALGNGLNKQNGPWHAADRFSRNVHLHTSPTAVLIITFRDG